MTGITQQKCSLKLHKWEQMIQICGGVQTHTLETVLTLNIVESCEFLFDLTVMFICVTVCVRTHLCACVCVSVSACLCIWVYPSGLFLFQIKASVVSTRWRGRDSQLAHTKLIRPVPVFVCMCVSQSMLMFYRRSHYSFHWLIGAHKKTQKKQVNVLFMMKLKPSD